MTGSLTVPARPVEERPDRLWSFAVVASAVALLAHAVFLVVFALLEVWVLCAVNAASITVFAVVVVFTRRRSYRVAMPLVVVELVTHAAVASWVLGWDTGFHYYVLLLVPIVLQFQEQSLRGRAVLAVGLAASYAAMNTALVGAPPRDEVADGVALALRLMNVTVFLSVVCYVSLVYARIVREAEQLLRQQAERDSLTGLYHRAGALRRFTDRDPGAAGSGRTWLVFVDVDHFKAVNDRFGHAAGDQALRAVAAAITRAVRTQDVVARWGGEEFLVLLPSTDRTTALAVAERIRTAVATCGDDGDGAGAALPALTVTVGVGVHHPEEALDTALARADAALYRGKAAGRDRVVLA